MVRYYVWVLESLPGSQLVLYPFFYSFIATETKLEELGFGCRPWSRKVMLKITVRPAWFEQATSRYDVSHYSLALLPTELRSACWLVAQLLIRCYVEISVSTSRWLPVSRLVVIYYLNQRHSKHAQRLDRSRALQAFVLDLHNQWEFVARFADVSTSSFRFHHDYVLTMPSCYSICTVSVLNAIRCPSHSLSCHTSIHRFFPGQSFSNKPRESRGVEGDIRLIPCRHMTTSWTLIERLL